MSDRFGLLYDDTFHREMAHAGEEVDFLEIIPDRYFGFEAFDLPIQLPVVLHSLNLSLGSEEVLDRAYVAELRAIARRLRPMWASDHLAVSHLGGVDLGLLSPVRYDTAAVTRIADKVTELQDQLRVPFLIENIAAYVRLPGCEFSETELLDRLVQASGCGLLLDLNNVVVNAANHGFDPYAYLSNFPLHAVREIHIAGHRLHGALYVDSHAEPVSESVWQLLRFVSGRIGPVHVLLERDDDVPPLNELLAELAVAKAVVRDGRSTAAQTSRS
jgi:uncharacterized protein (UPF0276 family)